MKKLFTILAFTLPLMYLASSCQKTTYPTDMIATIDTISLSTPNVVAAFIDTNTGSENIIITGTSIVYTPGTAFLPSIKIQAPFQVGTFTIGANTSAWAFTSANGYSGSPAVSGTIQITNIVNRVTGNFNFVCADGTTVKNGQFDWNFTK